MPPRRQSNALTGAAGVHFVASELSRRGLVALPTVRNAPGIDLIVTNLSGTWHANLQVKTSKDKVSFWPLSTKFTDFRGRANYYVFVRYLKKEARFEAFLERADAVIRDSKKSVREARELGNKRWAPWWPLPWHARKLARVRRQWDEFGRDAVWLGSVRRRLPPDVGSTQGLPSGPQGSAGGC
jgi:hypothetical protein